MRDREIGLSWGDVDVREREIVPSWGDVDVRDRKIGLSWGDVDVREMLREDGVEGGEVGAV